MILKRKAIYGLIKLQKTKIQQFSIFSSLLLLYANDGYDPDLNL
jgi:hypothetical protein